MISRLIRLWADRSIAAATEEIDRNDPEELVCQSTQHFRVAPDDFRVSSLELAGRWGPHACWKFVLKDGRKMVLHVEEAGDLETAIIHLPEYLGRIHENRF